METKLKEYTKGYINKFFLKNKDKEYDIVIQIHKKRIHLVIMEKEDKIKREAYNVKFDFSSYKEAYPVVEAFIDAYNQYRRCKCNERLHYIKSITHDNHYKKLFNTLNNEENVENLYILLNKEYNNIKETYEVLKEGVENGKC